MCSQSILDENQEGLGPELQKLVIEDKDENADFEVQENLNENIHTASGIENEKSFQESFSNCTDIGDVTDQESTRDTSEIANVSQSSSDANYVQENVPDSSVRKDTTTYAKEIPGIPVTFQVKISDQKSASF
ncbi:uncharacterized protein SPAPADRAFT_63628, partial [Spathaspora passalidarum NRRL Y-27907]